MSRLHLSACGQTDHRPTHPLHSHTHAHTHNTHTHTCVCAAAAGRLALKCWKPLLAVALTDLEDVVDGGGQRPACVGHL